MKIGVTGAFGFLGSNFISKLISDGYQKEDIIAFYSRTKSNPVFSSDAVTMRNLDICDKNDVIEKTKDLDILLHFAGKISYQKLAAKSTWITNVHGTLNILEAVEANGISKLIYVSSINVLGAQSQNDDFELGTEKNDVYNLFAGNPNFIKSPEMAAELTAKSLSGDFSFLKDIKVAYFDSKLAAYELVKRYVNEKQIPAVTVFPGTVVGPGDIHEAISELVDKVYNNALRLTFTGGTSFVDVRDCAEGIFLSMKKGIDGESYIISGKDEDNLSYKGFMSLIADTAAAVNDKVNRSFLAIPHWLGIIVCTIAELLIPKGSLNSALADSGKMIHYFTSDKASKELGFVHKYELRQSITDCYAFLKKN